ncbi:endonuclease domain-containing protein [Actinoplanes sp. RD1]|uniref:endonuclease domain-containing protein n=1 Tax=Actinoplanes sp. RD1 TaxID=3064538 RepID=UPI00274075B6|nr:DUF559 domain-containing protein [Actinoplanes sp. RD1]
MAQAWTDLPLDQPIVIDGWKAPGGATDLLPAGAPAVITYQPVAPRRTAPLVDDLLHRLDRVARELYPAWLPAAAAIEDPAGAGAVAVRSIALRDGVAGGHFGPFLADLAERALLGLTTPGRFTPELRAAGLARVIAHSFGRSRTALAFALPAALTPENERALIAAGRWLADCGGLGIWFTGNDLGSIDDVVRVAFRPPVAGVAPADDADDDVSDPIGYPAVAGRPHPASRAEQSLEAALAGAEWAAGREWNQHYQAHPLTNPIRVDLLWRAERCVVEIDGPEHRDPEQFAGDRQRDVQLQLAGYAVLRFTNAQVVRHLDLVVSQLRQFLDGRRTAPHERYTHA